MGMPYDELPAVCPPRIPGPDAPPMPGVSIGNVSSV